MVISTPIPFPYVHLCKALLLFFLITLPVVMNPKQGIFACVVLPSCVSMSLLGIDAIASELENPFGDDDNDLDFNGAITQFESECLKLLEIAGDTKATQSFAKYQFPEELL